MAQLSAFDVLGPNMIGPSSSHTAGAAVIAYLAQKMINGPIIKATFTLYGSFAHTYSGHGTDRALLGGLLGFHTDDKRIRDSFRIASERGIEYHFIPNDTVTDIHPNSVDILMENEAGTTMLIRGESLGSGRYCGTPGSVRSCCAYHCRSQPFRSQHCLHASVPRIQRSDGLHPC